MAKARQAVEEFIRKKRFTCPICQEDEGIELKIFPCQHYACQSCIGMFQSKPEDLSLIFAIDVCY